MTVSRANTVDEDAHRYAARHRAREGLHKPAAGEAAVEDVRRERNAASRIVDRREHGRVRLIAVDEQCNLVSRCQRKPGDGAGKLRDCAPAVRHVRRDLHERLIGGRHPHPSLDGERRVPPRRGSTPDPIDSDERVGQRADDRREPYEPRPADRGAHILLREDDVAGDDRRQQDVGHGQDEPERPGRRVKHQNSLASPVALSCDTHSPRRSLASIRVRLSPTE